MENMHGELPRKQYYVLSLADYQELRYIESMLVDMAQAAYDDQKPHTANEPLKLTRAEMYFFYMEISMQIADALNGTRRQNVMGPDSGRWQ